MNYFIDAFIKRIDSNSDGLITKQEIYEFYQKKKWFTPYQTF